jgi:chain length determinant protein EpsF
MNFQQFILILQARYKVALLVLAGTVALVLAVSLLMPDKYIASTSLVLDVKPDPLLGMMTGAASPTYMATQMDIITSDHVGQSVVKLLKLDQVPQIQAQWQKATKGKGELAVWLGSMLAKKLDAKPSRDSNVINISYTSEDPVFAATAANAFAQAYINTNLELKVEPARQNAQWFQVKVSGLRTELENAQARLAAFQKKTGIVPNSSKVQNEENSKIAELSGQLIVTEGQTADIQSKKKNIDSANTLADVMQNPIILSLKSDIIRLEGKLQEAGRNLGKNNPQYQSTEIEIETLKKKLDFETQQILTSINTANRVNKEKGSELQASILSHKKQAIEESADRDQIAVFENDVETAQKAYDLLVQRYTESNLQSQSNQTNISVLTPATEPLERSSPNIYKNMLIAVFAGTILGVGAAFAAEMFDQRVRTTESLATATGVPVLVYFTENSEPFGIKKLLKQMVVAVRLKFRFRRKVAVAA